MPAPLVLAASGSTCQGCQAGLAGCPRVLAGGCRSPGEFRLQLAFQIPPRQHRRLCPGSQPGQHPHRRTQPAPRPEARVRPGRARGEAGAEGWRRPAGSRPGGAAGTGGGRRRRGKRCGPQPALPPHGASRPPAQGGGQRWPLTSPRRRSPSRRAERALRLRGGGGGSGMGSPAAVVAGWGAAPAKRARREGSPEGPRGPTAESDRCDPRLWDTERLCQHLSCCGVGEPSLLRRFRGNGGPGSGGRGRAAPRVGRAAPRVGRTPSLTLCLPPQRAESPGACCWTCRPAPWRSLASGESRPRGPGRRQGGRAVEGGSFSRPREAARARSG